MTKQTKATVKATVQHEDLKGIRYGTVCDTAAVDKAIEHAVGTVKKGRIAVQQAAVLILLHAYKHGDYRKATALVNALGNSVNGKALVAWFEAYGGLQVDEESGEFSGWLGKDFIKDQFEAAKATPWWTLKQVNPWKGFDLNKELQRVLDGYGKAVSKVEKGNGTADMVSTKVDPAVKAQLEALLKTL